MYEELKSNIATFKKETTRELFDDDSKIALLDVDTYQDLMCGAQVLLDAIEAEEKWDVAQEQFNKLNSMDRIKQAIQSIIEEGNIIPEWEAEESDYATMVLDAIEYM